MRVKTYTIDLSEQMAVCDANYIRLLKLLGNTRSLNRRFIALPQLGMDRELDFFFVSLEVLEDFKYTSTICIRQVLTRDKDPVPGGTTVGESADDQPGNPVLYQAPEMIVRVYHDAKTAEVTSYQNHKYFKAVYPVPNQFMYQSDEKEQLNLFLAEWLNLCINEGMCNPGELHLEYLTCN